MLLFKGFFQILKEISFSAPFLFAALEALLKGAGESVTADDKNYVRISNELGKDVKVTLNCASKDDKIDETTLKNNEGMAWSFKGNIFGGTLFYCNAATTNG